MSQEMKDRKSAKSSVTRAINNLKRLCAEEEKEAVISGLDKVKMKFKEFERLHVIYHDSLIDEDKIDESDDYFFEVQDNYIAALSEAKAWLKSNTVTKSEPIEDEAASIATSADSLSHKEFLALMNLPKVELETYDGDPSSRCLMRMWIVFPKRIVLS